MDDTRLDKPRMDAPRKSVEEQLDYFRKGIQRFQTALAATGEIRRYFDVGGTTVCLVFAGKELVPFLTPALLHLEIFDGAHADLEVMIWDTASTGVEMLPPPVRTDFFYRTWRLLGLS